jgi:hypothetical protein
LGCHTRKYSPGKKITGLLPVFFERRISLYNEMPNAITGCNK